MKKHDENYGYGIVNKESFKEAYPELFKAIQADGFEEGFRAGRMKGKSDALAEASRKTLKAEIKKDMTLEEKVIADWKASPDIREEFKNIGTYYAYIKNKDKIKIVGGGMK